MSEELEIMEPFIPVRKDIIEAICTDVDFQEAVKQLYQDFYLGIKHTR